MTRNRQRGSSDLVTSRRVYLSTLLSSVALAGCSSGPTQSDGEQNPTPTTGQSGGAVLTESSPSENATVELVDYELLMGDTTIEQEQVPWLRVDVENPTSFDHGEVRLEHEYWSEDDSLIRTYDQYAMIVPAETTWRHYQRFPADEADILDHAEVRFTERTPRISSSVIDSATVTQSGMSVGEYDGSIEVVADVELSGSDLEQVVILGLAFDDQDRLRGFVSYYEEDPGSTVRMSERDPIVRAPTNLPEERPTSHEILVFDGYP